MIKTITIQLNEQTERYAVTVVDVDKTSATHRDMPTVQAALERAGKLVEGFEHASQPNPTPGKVARGGRTTRS